MPGTLFLVATPIGNLADISARAIETLKAVDLIACEDTRHTGKLLKHLGIRRKLVSYHEHNEDERAVELARSLSEGLSIAVVSDAGTPGIADPALRIVQRARETGATVVPIPGASAFVSALVASGLPTDSVFFGGFLPSKQSDRRKRLKEAAAIQATLVFYETPHRIGKSLKDSLEILGNRKTAVARELTKLHEEIVAGDLRELAGKFCGEKTKGEIVLIFDRNIIQESRSEAQDPQSLAARVAELENEGVDRKQALKQAAREFGLSKSEAYRVLHIKP